MEGLEYCPYIRKFQYYGNGWDYVAAIDNGVINVINTVPQLWNSGVATYQSLSRGTYLSDLGGELKQTGIGIKDYAVGSWNYTLNTPVGQQFLDAGQQLISPQTLETAVTLYAGAKITIPKASTIVRFTSNAAKSLKGTWVGESVAGWSQKAISYQEYVTGVKAGSAFEVNGVRFDGIRKNTLLEAKSSYDNFVNKQGQFYSWFKGQGSLLDQARRQIAAADGAAIEWNFASQKTLDATQ